MRDIEEQVGISKNLIRGALANNGMPIRDYKTGKNVPKEWTKTKRAGHPPFGWTYLDGNLVIDPKEHLIVRKILKFHQSDKTNQYIAVYLNANKFPTRKGGHWSRSVIHTIIERETKRKP